MNNRTKYKWTLPFTADELRIKLQRIKGKQFTRRPTKADRSTTFRVWDVCFIANVSHYRVCNFMSNKYTVTAKGAPAAHPPGQKALQRINDVLDQVNAGHWTKTQYGKYQYHENPVVPPKRVMQVNLDTGSIIGTVSPPPKEKRMPSFSALFKGK